MAKGGGSDQADQKTQDRDYDQDFQQRETGVVANAWTADACDAIQVAMPVPYVACMVLVAQVYALPPRVLPAIQRIEGGRPGLAMMNANGTEDFGVMQVNSSWLPALVRYTRLPADTVRTRLIDEPCFNIAAAGLVFRTELDRTGGDLMQAVGNYHSRTPIHHFPYRAKVIEAARALFETPAQARSFAPSR